MDELKVIAESIKKAGGRSYLAGGAVRDSLLGRPSKDRDLEVYGLSREALLACLKALGPVNEVGASFGVFKLKKGGAEFDLSLPRKDSKVAAGHRGFSVSTDPGLSMKEACARRDFTVNAMLQDPLTGEIHDFFGGREDLDKKILRHCSPAFSEDPLRVLRGVQFAARFGFSMASDTKALCRSINLKELARERIWEEWAKLLLLAERPSEGMRLADEIGALEMFPEILALKGVAQEPEWHPEGDVWTHNNMVLDEAAKLRVGDRKEDLILMWGALCHDLGKPPTTKVKDGRIRSKGHSEAGLPLTRNLLGRVSEDREILDGVLPLVQFHLVPTQYYLKRAEISDSAIRRLALKVPLDRLIRVAQADHFGRSTPDALARDFPGGAWLRERAEALRVADQAPKPLVLGRHALEMGLKGGPQMGQLLKQAFEAQLDGAFSDLDGGLAWLRGRVSTMGKS